MTTPDKILTPAEVAAIFKVDPKTVSRWAKDGRLRAFKTPGGHRRFFKSEIDNLLNGSQTSHTDSVEG